MLAFCSSDENSIKNHLHDTLIAAFRFLSLTIKESGTTQEVKKAVRGMDTAPAGEKLKN